MHYIPPGNLLSGGEPQQHFGGRVWPAGRLAVPPEMTEYYISTGSFVVVGKLEDIFFPQTMLSIYVWDLLSSAVRTSM